MELKNQDEVKKKSSVLLDRALYITFYVLYLVVLAIALWFLLYYSKVPAWVWVLFGTALIIAIVGILIKEFLMKRYVTKSGKDVSPKSLSFWSIMYIIFHIIAFTLLFVGLIFVIKYSTIPAYVWVILAVAILFSIISNMILALVPNGFIISLIFAIIAFILYIAGIILLVVYSKSPWWVWLLVGIAFLFAVLSSIFEYLSEKNEKIIEEESTKTVKESAKTVKKPLVDSDDELDFDILPTALIPEQKV